MHRSGAQRVCPEGQANAPARCGHSSRGSGMLTHRAPQASTLLETGFLLSIRLCIHTRETGWGKGVLEREKVPAWDRTCRPHSGPLMCRPNCPVMQRSRRGGITPQGGLGRKPIPSHVPTASLS